MLIELEADGSVSSRSGQRWQADERAGGQRARELRMALPLKLGEPEACLLPRALRLMLAVSHLPKGCQLRARRGAPTIGQLMNRIDLMEAAPKT